MIRKKTITRPGGVKVIQTNASNTKIMSVEEIANIKLKNNKEVLDKFIETFNKLTNKERAREIIDNNRMCEDTTTLKNNKNSESGYSSNSSSNSSNNSSNNVKTKVQVLKTDNSPVPFELLINKTESDIEIIKSIVSYKKVCKIDKTVLKKTKFSDTNNASIFVLTLEIAIQNYVHELCKIEDTPLNNLYVPEINDYFLTDSNNEIVMSMDYVDTEPLSFNNIDKCISILDYLRGKKIYHNDTHTENVRQTKTEPKKIVLFDWGKANIESITPSSTGLYKDMKEEDFNNWINAHDTIITGKYEITAGVDLYGGQFKKNNIKSKKIKSKKLKSKKLKSKNKKSKSKKNKN